MFDNVYDGRKVLVTGHTGFKGSWLSAWLLSLGADVRGFSIDVPTSPANFEILGLEQRIDHLFGDVRLRDEIVGAALEFQPDLVFHLAAQPLVRRSYDDPATTFETNALGTLNVMETIRRCPSVRAAVIITSDKCYRNVEWPWGYRETDRLGGEDPYSGSKGCAELIVYSYIRSFFRDGPHVASARAGNVIGGGDWAADRIMPDAVRAWSDKEAVSIRSPEATRPWQHVLEPLSGYLWLGANLIKGRMDTAGEAFNFGPDAKVNQSVAELLETAAERWPGASWTAESPDSVGKKESGLLKLCCDKALHTLGWHAVLDFKETVAMTVDWYQEFYKRGPGSMPALTGRQISTYEAKAKETGLPWTV